MKKRKDSLSRINRNATEKIVLDTNGQQKQQQKKKLSLQPQTIDDFKPSSNIWNSSPYQKDDDRADQTCVIPQNDDFSSPPPPVASVHSSFNLQYNPDQEESTTPPGNPGQSNALYPKIAFDDDEDRGSDLFIFCLFIICY